MGFPWLPMKRKRDWNETFSPFPNRWNAEARSVLVAVAVAVAFSQSQITTHSFTSWIQSINRSVNCLLNWPSILWQLLRSVPALCLPCWRLLDACFPSRVRHHSPAQTAVSTHQLTAILLSLPPFPISHPPYQPPGLLVTVFLGSLFRLSWPSDPSIPSHPVARRTNRRVGLGHCHALRLRRITWTASNKRRQTSDRIERTRLHSSWQRTPSNGTVQYLLRAVRTNTSQRTPTDPRDGTTRTDNGITDHTAPNVRRPLPWLGFRRRSSRLGPREASRPPLQLEHGVWDYLLHLPLRVCPSRSPWRQHVQARSLGPRIAGPHL